MKAKARVICVGCHAVRPKGAHWFYKYPDIGTGLTPVGAWCRKCVPVSVYAAAMNARRDRRMAP